MRIAFTFYLVLWFGTTAYAQLGGESTYQFLNLISSPRQAALGGKSITNVSLSPKNEIHHNELTHVLLFQLKSAGLTKYLTVIKDTHRKWNS